MKLNADQLREVLGTLHFSGALSERSRSLLAELSAVRTFATGQTIFREGNLCDAAYVIESGHVALDVQIPGRGTVRILTLGPGDLLAWSGLVGGPRATASAVALETTRVIEFPARKLRELAEQDHEFGYALMRTTAETLAKRLTATRLQMLDLFAHPSEASDARPGRGGT